MNGNKTKQIFYTGLALLVSTTFATAALAAKKKAIELTSVKTTDPITLDGKTEDAWKAAKVAEIELEKTPYKPSNGYKGAKSTTVKVRSLYDNENVYFFIQYNDPTESMERMPWVKQEDGSWKQLKNPDDTNHDNTYYEDKFAIFWNINTKGFETKGCDIACHRAKGGKINNIPDKSPARKYTESGETLDMWHLKGVRTGPVGQIDDQYVDSTNDPAQNEEWGRKGDVKTGGGYSNNVNEAKTGPAFMNSPAGAQDKYLIRAENKVPFEDTFKPGDVVPGIIVEPFTGPRADIPVKAVWDNKMWNLEIQRKLVTTGEKSETQDVQFSDLKKTYYFGVSVFDNSQINHLYQEGVTQMTFK